jgi:L-ornithine N5-oxygenase
MTSIPTHEIDAIGIGFGPAGLSLACAFADARELGQPAGRLAVRFYEQAASTEWHPELLLRGTDINHHVFRDLVTPRNPRSRFSFAMYLKEKGRMFDFGLLGRPASRHEWSDYVAWVAAQLRDDVTYSHRVTEVLPVVRDGRLQALEVPGPDGHCRSRKLVLSCGSAPSVPEAFAPLVGERVFHTSRYLTRIRAMGQALPRRWLVLGSGQSASESVLDLLGRREDIVVNSVHRSAGFLLTQLGQFPNQVFSPARVDYFHSLDLPARKRFLEQSKATNYAGIDPDESQALFSVVYEDALQGRERLRMRPYSCVQSVEPAGQAYLVTLQDVFSGETTAFEVDAIVLATGYQQHLVPPLLAGLRPWLKTDADGGVLIDRDYRLALTAEADVEIYVNGLSERAHGISDSQSFSLMALRAERIANAIGAR